MRKLISSTFVSLDGVTTVLSEDVPRQVAALKDQDGPDLLLQGSGDLIRGHDGHL